MFTLSGFADEISPDLDAQLDVLQSLHITHLELRGVWNKNVLALDDREIKTVKTELARRGIKVSAIASPIGKIKIDDPFGPHLKDFRRAIDIAEYLDCPYIRIFSFFVPEGEADAYRPQVMDRLAALLDEAEGHAVTLLHENERHIYGDIPRRCLDLLEGLDSPQLRMTFDPANFVLCGVRPFSDGYELLKDYIAYLHIKDARMAEQEVAPAGEGDGQLPELFRALVGKGYDGFASLEPHLAKTGAFSGFSGPDLFGVAAQALRRVLQDAGGQERA
jgi:sugar phosphate isomerase/epimerase